MVAWGSPGQASGGATGEDGSGRLFIAWDDLFPAGVWPDLLVHTFGSTPGSETDIRGGPLTGMIANRNFGEEILGGLDYDADGAAELFVGDLTASSPHGVFAGLGHVYWDAALLKGESFVIGAEPPGVMRTDFYGGANGDIGGDTALHGDFDGDGTDDLAFSSPHADPHGRSNAGTLFVFFGDAQRWPAAIDLERSLLPLPEDVQLAIFDGALGDSPGDTGDTLSYSASVGDVDGDCRVDLVTNEMVGNGVAAGAEDVGNLVVFPGRLFGERPVILRDGFESGDTRCFGAAVP